MTTSLRQYQRQNSGWALANLVISFNTIQTFARVLGAIGLLVWLSACATNVTVTAEIPKPLTERLPLKARLNLTEKFKNYEYLEDDKKRSITSLAFGDAQVKMFRQVFAGAFSLTQSENEVPDLVVTPKVLSVQYSAPRETQLNIYEVFLKYRISITRADGEKIADWVITGYGKTPTAQFKGAETAFDSATNVALRDVGAQITIGIPLQKSIQDIIRESGAKIESMDDEVVSQDLEGEGR